MLKLTTLYAVKAYMLSNSMIVTQSFLFRTPYFFCDLTDIEQFSKTLPLIGKIENFTINTTTSHKQA